MMINMGRVRPTHIKRLARELADEGDFNEDFEHNKEVLKELGEFESKKLRNRVAGYLVRVMENRKF